MIVQKDEVTVVVTVVQAYENPCAALLVYDTIGRNGVRRRMTQKVPLKELEMLHQARDYAETKSTVRAVIVTEWREDGVDNYLKTFLPNVPQNGASTNGTPTQYEFLPNMAKKPAMVKE